MRVKELLALGEKQLRECGIPDAANDSKELYCYMMNMPRNRLFMEYQNMLSEEPIDKYFALLDRRSKGEPLQYIVGSQEFMGLPFVVTPDVLIPRQDTEILAENAISLLKDRTPTGQSLKERSGKIRMLRMSAAEAALSESALESWFRRQR